jgi:hypothetical protein
LLRCSKSVEAAILLAIFLATLDTGAAFGQTSGSVDPQQMLNQGELPPEDSDTAITPDEFGAPYELDPSTDAFGAPTHTPPGYWSTMSRFGLRHSYTHSRSVGWGSPLVGTSWLNRPFYVGADIGNLWMMRSVEDSVGRDVDAVGGIFFGGDWDYYWGSELAFHLATTEFVNSNAPDEPVNHSMFLWSYSLMYYPWGDSAIRPYWRWGIGNTRVDFPLDDGTRHGEWLFTFPVGVGVKWPIRPWLAARTELTDYLAFDGSDVPTQNNLTLTLGLEWHFGAHRRSYWPWHPSRHIW